MYIVNVVFQNGSKEYSYLAPMYQEGDDKALVDSLYSGQILVRIVSSRRISFDEYRKITETRALKSVILCKNSSEEARKEEERKREAHINSLLQRIAEGAKAISELAAIDKARARTIWNWMKDQEE